MSNENIQWQYLSRDKFPRWIIIPVDEVQEARDQGFHVRCMVDQSAIPVQWIVNIHGEIGVLVANEPVYFYKGDALRYEGDERPKYRPIGKREFSESLRFFESSILTEEEWKETIDQYDWVDPTVTEPTKYKFFISGLHSAEGETEVDFDQYARLWRNTRPASEGTDVLVHGTEVPASFKIGLIEAWATVEV